MSQQFSPELRGAVERALIFARGHDTDRHPCKEEVDAVLHAVVPMVVEECAKVADENANAVRHVKGALAGNGRIGVTLQFRRDGTEAPMLPTIMVEKIAPRGKRPPVLVPTFCPFCGLRYEPEAA